jgi:uncharacterized protein (TIGR02246 family)
MRSRLFLLALPCLVLVAGSGAWAEDAKGNPAEEKALQKRAQEFIAAFDKGDAKAIAAFWTLDGDYVDQAGTTLSGRKAIEAAFGKQFAAARGGKLSIRTRSLRFLTPECAVEDGLTEVHYPDDVPPIATRYTAIHVKKDGQWYLSNVRDAVAVAPSHYPHLQDLDWLTGDWMDETGKGPVGKVTYSWAENNNFLVATFVTTLKDVPVAGGTQWIGWDAANKQIRSWAFYSNGSTSEGVWSNDGNKWTARMTTTTPDGKKLSATNIHTRIDADHATWQSVKRTLDGKELPDTEVVKMKRVK